MAAPVLATALSIILAACAATAPLPPVAELGDGAKKSDVPKTAATSPARPAAAAKRASNEDLASLKQRHGENQKDPKIAAAYARGLKSTGKLAEALAVIERTKENNAGNRDLAFAAALLQLELGRAKLAQTTLAQLAASGDQDWRVHSALGIATSSQGQQAAAQKHFAKALQLSPGQSRCAEQSRRCADARSQSRAGRGDIAAGGELAAPAPQVSQNLLLAGGLNSRKPDSEKTKVTELAKPAAPTVAPVPKSN